MYQRSVLHCRYGAAQNLAWRCGGSAVHSAWYDPDTKLYTITFDGHEPDEFNQAVRIHKEEDGRYLTTVGYKTKLYNTLLEVLHAFDAVALPKEKKQTTRYRRKG